MQIGLGCLNDIRRSHNSAVLASGSPKHLARVYTWEWTLNKSRLNSLI